MLILFGGRRLRAIEAMCIALIRKGDTTMGILEDFVAAQQAHNQSISDSLDDLGGDLANLKDQIKALSDAQGSLTPEQQALLTTLTATAQTLDDKAKALAAQNAAAPAPADVPPADVPTP